MVRSCFWRRCITIGSITTLFCLRMFLHQKYSIRIFFWTPYFQKSFLHSPIVPLTWYNIFLSMYSVEWPPQNNESPPPIDEPLQLGIQSICQEINITMTSSHVSFPPFLNSFLQKKLDKYCSYSLYVSLHNDKMNAKIIHSTFVFNPSLSISLQFLFLSNMFHIQCIMYSTCRV